MDVSTFQQARLIPVSGIKGDQEQERRTTSAFLAVMVAVPEFAKALLSQLGAPAGRVSTFIEPEFEFLEKKIRPDGLVVVERGSRRWTALVEVKTNKNDLAADQLNEYLELCRMHDVDALWTISNQMLTLTGQHPTPGLDIKKAKKTTVHHFSWVRILTEALLQKDYRGVSDPDQAWILGELIRFLQHPASGATEFNDMGDTWVPVREATLNRTLTVADKRITPVIQNFESLMRFAAFRLSAKLGVAAREIAPKLAKTDPAKHAQQTIASFVETGQLTGGLSIPKTVSDIAVTADLRASTIQCSIEVKAPLEGRPLTRVNWLLKQLRDAPESVRIEARVKHASKGGSPVCLLGEARLHPEKLVPADGKEIAGFELTLMQKMGTKRAAGTGSFINSVIDAIEMTYNSILERITEWTAKAPKLPLGDTPPAADSPFDPEGTDVQALPGSNAAQQPAMSVHEYPPTDASELEYVNEMTVTESIVAGDESAESS